MFLRKQTVKQRKEKKHSNPFSYIVLFVVCEFAASASQDSEGCSVVHHQSSDGRCVASMSTATDAFPSVVELNVGGVMYTTSLGTLTSQPGSHLAAIFTGHEEVSRDSKGR